MVSNAWGNLFEKKGEASNKVKRCCDDNEKDEKEGSIERDYRGRRERENLLRKKKKDKEAARGKEAEETERFERKDKLRRSNQIERGESSEKSSHPLPSRPLSVLSISVPSVLSLFTAVHLSSFTSRMLRPDQWSVEGPGDVTMQRSRRA